MDALESVFPDFFQLCGFDGDFLQRLTSAERFRPDGSDFFSKHHTFQLFAVFKRVVGDGRYFKVLFIDFDRIASFQGCEFLRVLFTGCPCEDNLARAVRMNLAYFVP
jgi:hypothetical protein